MRTATPTPPHSPLAVTRIVPGAGAVKFCLAAGGPPDAPLEAEAVLMRMAGYGGTQWYTLCVSSQIGCGVGCPFCETGRMGRRGDLGAEAIVAQYLAARRWLEPQGESIRNVVFMGMGEPLDNLDAVLGALTTLGDPKGIALPLSRVTLSTVGRRAGLARLAELARQPPWADLRLAISLHAVTDGLRNRLVPANRAMPLPELREALRAYPLKRRGRLLLQYTLLGGVNDAVADAEALAEWCRSLRCTVNVIPYNPQRDPRWVTPSAATIGVFLDRLRRAGVRAKCRRTHGAEVFAACGQLGTRQGKSGLQKDLEFGLRSVDSRHIPSE
ncbi:23S rRNA (adenine(2503)-C(2))-methyltransferase RlmN [Candidatus Binatia bacterium]|nr:23S rRNA (adenine(2503)-C(2))-methyltransferase RlmN [Candidatus Binatia bacterium]